MAYQPRQQLYPPSGRIRSTSDPLSAAIAPPPDETPEERERRLRAEEEARRRSESIDRMLKEGERAQRRKKTVKVLLLGQSESGKSTTLKQFQLLHTPEAFHAERIAWRFVIYLNLVRSIRRILEAISPEADSLNGEETDDFDSTETASIIISSNGRPPSSMSSSSAINYESYRRRLLPLQDLELRLIQQLSDPEDNDDNEATRLPAASSSSSTPPRDPYYTNGGPTSGGIATSSSYPQAGPSYDPRMVPRISIPTGARSSPASPTSPASLSSQFEIAVPTGSKWKKVLSPLRIQSPKTPHSGEVHGWWEDPDDPVHVVHMCAPAMSELWRDPKVRQRLAERRLRLEESSGFYLDEIDRITARMYFPTDEDVLKARLKTTGVVEHTFTLSKSSEFRGVDWKIYDVGGAYNQRQAWAPYFDDVNAIIFLAPISAFDQVLFEEPKINRLEDSFILWKQVISNKLLADVNIVLFLNKCDLLKAKLQSGVRLSHYMSYNQSNDFETVSKYFYNKFGLLHQTHSPNKARELYIHFTSVTDTRKTHTIISRVRDIILTGNLKSSSLM